MKQTQENENGVFPFISFFLPILSRFKSALSEMFLFWSKYFLLYARFVATSESDIDQFNID